MITSESKKKDKDLAVGTQVIEAQDSKKVCFVIMPFNGTPEYEGDYFDVAYKYLFKPAIEQAGYTCKRADDPNSTYCIRTEILEQILSADIVLCDLTARNPNVMFELGLRQAFDLPVVLVQESGIGNYIFDISTFNTISYDKSLRADKVEEAVNKISSAIVETSENYKKGEKVNSIIKELSISQASIPANKYNPNDVLKMIYNEQKNINRRLSMLENYQTNIFQFNNNPNEWIYEDDNIASLPSDFYYRKYLNIIRHKNLNYNEFRDTVKEKLFSEPAISSKNKNIIWSKLCIEYEKMYPNQIISL